MVASSQPIIACPARFVNGFNKMIPSSGSFCWWAVKDSNLRRLCQLIYSQPPLATWVTAQAIHASQADGGIRTRDLALTRRLLCRLSYVGAQRIIPHPFHPANAGESIPVTAGFVKLPVRALQSDQLHRARCDLRWAGLRTTPAAVPVFPSCRRRPRSSMCRKHPQAAEATLAG